jgi:hypothetical protein
MTDWKPGKARRGEKLLPDYAGVVAYVDRLFGRHGMSRGLAARQPAKSRKNRRSR